MKKPISLLFLMFLATFSVIYGQKSVMEDDIVDAKATSETKALFYNLKNLVGKGVA